MGHPTSWKKNGHDFNPNHTCTGLGLGFATASAFRNSAAKTSSPICTGKLEGS